MLEEVEGQAQATVALKKRKRVKEKSLIWTSMPKRKRLESASHAQDLEEENSILLLTCLYFSLFILVIRRGFPVF